MSAPALVALVEFAFIVVLVGIAMGKHFRVLNLEADNHTLTVRAEEAEAWAEHWEQQAEHAAEEAETACKQHANLERMYSRVVREQLAANWPIAAHYAAMRRQSRR